MKYFLLLILLPGFLMAQNKVKPKKNSPSEITIAKSDSYVINGLVKGYPDGTVVDLINGYNGTPESSGIVNKGMFSFKGNVTDPGLKIIVFNKNPPYISLFLDNSNIIITGNKDSLEKALITGSVLNDQFIIFNNTINPYLNLFLPEADIDSLSGANASKVLEGFVKKYPSSYVSPLAILRHFQVSNDGEKMDALYNSLDAQIKAAPISQYISQQIVEAKKNPLGVVLPDFTQLDTSGNALSLSSLKGKYVLVDFWASWCGPCRQENPNLVSAFQRYKNKNFTVLGVSLDKAKKPWMDAIKMDNLTWPQVSDLKGWQNAVAQQFQIYSIPQNFLVDPSGKLIAKNLRGAALDQKLASLLK